METLTSIHVLDSEDNIIDYFDSSDYAIIDSEQERDISQIFERFDFKVISERAENLKNRVRIITFDSQNEPVEFIITKMSEGIDGYVEIESNASYLEDMITAEPFDPGSFKGYTSHQFLDEITKDTGWKRSPDSEFSSGKTVTWSDINDRIQMAKLGQTRYNLRLDREIILGRNKVEKRYLKYVSKEPEFYGAEINYGDNMINLERTIDYSNIVTRMIGYGPQKEDGSRVRVVVDDKDAQMQFGIKPIWGVHEISSNDTNMSKKRATTLTKNQLKKQNQEAFSYEISSIERNGRIGEMIRVKNTDFHPPFYADVQAIKEVYNPLTGVSTFTYSFIKEYKEEEISQNVINKMREIIRDVQKNMNTDYLVESVKENIKDLYEVKIPRQKTPPDNPNDGDLWLDTSNPDRNILMKYDKELGKWVKTSPTEAHEVGAITKEEAFYGELKQLLEATLLTHMNHINQINNAINNEYLDDDFIKSDLQVMRDKLMAKIAKVQRALDNVDLKTVNYHELSDIFLMFDEYRALVHDSNVLLEKANKSIMEWFSHLQSQYSEEKFIEAMEEIASVIGGTFDGTNIIVDVPFKEDLEKLNQSIRDYLNGEIDSLDSKLGKQIETVVNKAKDEFGVSVESVEKKLEGLKIGGRNLVLNSNQRLNKPVGRTYAIIPNFQFTEVGTYTISFDSTTTTDTNQFKRHLIYIGRSIARLPRVDDGRTHVTLEIEERDLNKPVYLYIGPSAAESRPNGGYFEKIKIEKGNTPTDWTPAPEDLDNSLNDLSQEITKNSSELKVLENQINLKVDNKTVKQILDNELRVVKSNVQTNQTELKILSDNLSSKVDKSEYTADMNGVTRDIRNTKSEMKQLSDSYDIKVSSLEQQFNSLEVGGANLILDSDKRISNKDYRVNEYKLTEGININDVYTLTIKGNLENNEGDGHFRATLSSSTYFLKDIHTGNHYLKKIGKDLHRITFKPIVSEANNGTNDLRIYNHPREGIINANIEWVKLEKGTVATDWTPAPKDVSDKILEQFGQIIINRNNINQRVSYQEINKTNKTLQRVLSELTLDTKGIKYTYDYNGMISGFSLDKNYFKLNHNLIEINDGDVVIKDGKTFIKNLSAERVQVAYNNVSNSVRITGNGLETVDSSGAISSRLNGRGHHFYHNANYVGHIGTGSITNYPNVRGLRMTLDTYGEYLAFSYRTGNLDPDDPNEVAMLWSKGSGSYERGFHFNEDIKIKHNKVLETSYIRPLNASAIKRRLYIGEREVSGVTGVSIRHNSSTGSGVHFGENRVNLVANSDRVDGNTVGILTVARDNRSYYVQSLDIYNRTYSGSANVRVTTTGALGRVTSALKYKLSVEPQFKTNEEQLEHSKKILNIKPKTWFDREESEIYAKEIEESKRLVEDDFEVKRHFGAIADEFHDLGLTELVQYDEETGEIEGLSYDRIPIHLIVLIKDLYEEINKLKEKLK